MRALAAILLTLTCAAPAAANEQHGYVQFPRDEHHHLDGWNYWWGAAELVTKAGNRYTVGIAFDSFYGVGATGHQVFAHQGPYEGLSIMTEDGPVEWGHPEGSVGRHVSKISPYVPGLTDLLDFRVLDSQDSLHEIGSWARTTMKAPRYRLHIDNKAAKVHPTGERVKLQVDLDVTMRRKPLLAGGTGQWWYGIPETYGYPSRSYQYEQSARRLRGTIALQQPDGTLRRERIVPKRSRMLMVREYDANPEDLFAGLALAQGTQLHPRYASYYHGGMPWELIFLDLDNGAQLMLGVLAFHETRRGTITPVTGAKQPTYKILATLQLPDGRSVALDNAVQVEHLSYRKIVGRVPTFAVAIQGMWTQSWDYRVRYPGGTVTAPDGTPVKVPPFDLGVTPQLTQAMPASDDRGNRLTQRVPFDAAGSWNGCPMRGFGWSELIINWHDKEERDPWWTGGSVPPVPRRCGDGASIPPGGTTGPLDPEFGPEPPIDLETTGCSAYNPGQPVCEYTSPTTAGVGGHSSTPGGWTVEIRRPGLAEPIVIKGLGGDELYACGTIKKGDVVRATAEPGSMVVPGDPGICI